jgi:hypothetical protein
MVLASLSVWLIAEFVSKYRIKDPHAAPHRFPTRPGNASARTLGNFPITFSTKASLHILGGMAVGFVAGFVIAGDLAFLFMWLGGISVSVRKIRREKSSSAHPRASR